MPEKHYFVRSCNRDSDGLLVSPSPYAEGFIWPEKVGSVVVAPDWNPDVTCGHGLHGLRPGDNIPGTWATGSDAVWLVCSYDPETVVDLGGKIKVPSCVVEHVVDLKDGASFLVPQWLRERGVTEPIYQALVEVGDQGTVSVGEYGTAKAGKHGTAIAASYGTAIAGEYGTARTSYKGTAIAGDYGQATAGYSGTATVGYKGTARALSRGVATAGNHGTAIAGPRGTAIAGLGGMAQASVGGIIQIRWQSPWLNDRIVIGYVGEDGIEADTLYQLDHQGTFVKVVDNA